MLTWDKGPKIGPWYLLHRGHGRSQSHSGKQWLSAIMVTNDNSQYNFMLDEHIQNMLYFSKTIPKPETMGEKCAIWMAKK